MANIKIHNVTKIEIRKVDKGNGYNCRDIVIYNKTYNAELGDYVAEKLHLDLFLNDLDVAKLVYSKET